MKVPSSLPSTLVVVALSSVSPACGGLVQGAGDDANRNRDSGAPLSGEDAGSDAATALDAGCFSSGTLTLATRGSDGPWFGENIATDDANVYWLEHGNLEWGAGRLMRVPKCGGAVVQIASTLNYPRLVAVDSQRAYWTNSGRDEPSSVMSVALSGGPSSVVASGYDFSGIALDLAHVYWIDSMGVRRVPKNGGQATTLTAFSNPSGSVALSRDPVRVVWTTLSTTGWSLTSLPIFGTVSGGRATTLHEGAGLASPLSVDDTYVYFADSWGERGFAEIFRVPIAGGAPTVLASGQTATSLTADDRFVYWINSGDNGDGAIVRVPKLGGAPMTVASGLYSPMDIAVDAKRVYWLDYRTQGLGSIGGTIMSAPK